MPMARKPTAQKRRARADWTYDGMQDDYFAGPIPPVDHAKALRDVGRWSNTFRRFLDKNATPLDPEKVIAVLNAAGVRVVLLGAHAVAGWSRVVCAADDVDVLVPRKYHRKAVQAVTRAFPELTPEKQSWATRFRDPRDGVVRIDVMKPVQAVHRAALKNTVPVGESHHVPSLEMLLTCKFAAMAMPDRPWERKYLDAADFSRMVLHNKDDISQSKLKELGKTVHAGGGTELLKMLDDVFADRTFDILRARPSA